MRAKFFRPDLRVLRFPLLSHLVGGHLVGNTNLLTSYTSVLIRKNILNSSLSWSKGSENNSWNRLLCFSASYGFIQHFLFLVFEILLCFLLSFLNCEHAATMQRVPIFSLSVSLLLPTYSLLHAVYLYFIKNFFWSFVF